MASKLDICNLALSKIGVLDDIAAIDPPEQSQSALACARFYNTALKVVTEARPWKFTMRRAEGVLLAGWTFKQWQYAYALPSGAIEIIAVIPKEAANDYSNLIIVESSSGESRSAGQGVTIPVAFVKETLPDGTEAILTNLEDAVIRYRVYVDDPAKYSGSFVDALSSKLATYICGPIIKGSEGIKTAQAMEGAYQNALMNAAKLDGYSKNIHVSHAVDWMAGR